MRYIAKATTPRRLCGNKIRPPSATISQANLLLPRNHSLRRSYGWSYAGLTAVLYWSYFSLMENEVLWQSCGGLTPVSWRFYSGFMELSCLNEQSVRYTPRL